MFRINLLAAMLTAYLAMAEEFSFLNAESPTPKIEEKKIDWPPEEAIETDRNDLLPNKTLKVSASIYHPETSQTDSTPYITADGSRINKKDPKKHRWIAISRDLHTRWGGNINYGDSLWVTGISDDLDGLYIVRDIMNRRIKKQIDLLVGRKDKVMGFWRDVYIAKLD
jgi:3D (Asp-Asp-Asp) domain-containing protein